LNKYNIRKIRNNALKIEFKKGEEIITFEKEFLDVKDAVV
jgi:hypothetical protein